MDESVHGAVPPGIIITPRKGGVSVLRTGSPDGTERSSLWMLLSDRLSPGKSSSLRPGSPLHVKTELMRSYTEA